MDGIQATIKAYILEQFLRDTSPDELTPVTPLTSGGILDSLATVRLVMFLEQHFGIAVGADEVTAANFEDLERVAALVARKQGARGTA
jgi:acyl carrier protein